MFLFQWDLCRIAFRHSIQVNSGITVFHHADAFGIANHNDSRNLDIDFLGFPCLGSELGKSLLAIFTLDLYPGSITSTPVVLFPDCQAVLPLSGHLLRQV